MLLNFNNRLLLLSLVLLSGCGGHVYHIVEPGETLYSIGWVYDSSYQDLARWNGIPPPYTVHTGQRLRVVPPTEGERSVAISAVSPIQKSEKVSTKAASNSQVSSSWSADNRGVSWQWPTKGKVVNYFSSSKLNKGIDIVGEQGQPINAAASGKVVYSGTGLVGMGKLIIINHSTQYLSAYAHNDEILVKEGQQVKKGEMIARMGRSGTDRVMLHFQIRREGKPVDPMRFLSAKE